MSTEVLRASHGPERDPSDRSDRERRRDGERSEKRGDRGERERRGGRNEAVRKDEFGRDVLASEGAQDGR